MPNDNGNDEDTQEYNSTISSLVKFSHAITICDLTLLKQVSTPKMESERKAK